MNKYKIHYQENQKIKSKIIISDDLEKEKLPKNIVKIKKIKKLEFKNIKIMNKASEEQIIELFIQLSIMLDSNILLIDAIKILQKSIKNSHLSDILNSMESALQNGRAIYKALEKYEKDLNPIIIPFFKIFEKNGNIKAVIAALSTLLKIRLKNKKDLKNSLRYPIIVMVTFILALSMIFIFVVPKFENIFLQYHMQLPISTILLLTLKNFFLEYSLYLLLFFIFIYFAIKYFISKSEKFSYYKDKIIIKYLPIVGSLNKTYELYNFFVALNILLQSKYEFHLSMGNSLILIKNKYLLARISSINEHLKNGESISYAFNSTELFDELVISLIRSGEASNSLDICVERLQVLYEKKFDKKIKSLTSLIEPIFFILISSLILWIMLAIFTPIWNMSEMLNI
ncbi:Type II secretion system F domain protein [Arcobacter nitrofigilis DSM 7299]|uniref:Type II secretion system F domain protein n=1 Tax=Arcobacter nitrofigilis (strain ATCC 33309 / DSM 7299 / CCUG 15893 / LMG 7604 / NCTC 12251 / CI) TaxID=572480 RepID=D5V1A1_ARCNC|nr:type II secretion system F family protein [Arcobacter nitrofigilis]ADG94063.1 Type II secretion system F domain protein [Arcobacter nitrofigilis DSM 7299]